MLPYSKHFLKIYLPGKGWLYFWGLTFLLLNVATQVAVPVLFKDAIDISMLDGAVFNEGGTVHILDSAKHDLIRIGLIIICLGPGMMVFRVLSRIILFIPGRRIEAELRQDYFDAMVSLPSESLGHHPLGDLISRGTTDVNTMRVTVSMGVLHSANTIITLSLCLFLMIRMHVGMTLIALLLSPVSLIMIRLLSQRLMFLVREHRVLFAHLSDNIRETLSAHTLMAVYPVFDNIFDRFKAHNDRYCAVSEKVISARTPLNHVGMGQAKVSMFLLLMVGGYMHFSDPLSLTVAELVAFFIYINMIQEPLRNGGWLITMFQRGEISAERLFDIINEAEEYAERQSERPVQTSADLAHALQHGDDLDDTLIRVSGLSFQYPSSSKTPTKIPPFSLDIPEWEIKGGRAYGLFGTVGCGKSTLLNIVAGIEPVPRGVCAFKGVDYLDINEAALMRQFSVAPQESRHFARTIRGNIDLVRCAEDSDPGVTSTDSHYVSFEDAYEISCLQPDVDGFSDGLDSLLGENGINLSGGQKQRMSILRALMKRHRVLILDDIVSAVDHHTESRILDRLFKTIRSMNGHTVLIASHRISALIPCDEILVMDDGRIVDTGTHDELLTRNDLYRRTFEHQVLEYRIEDDA